MLQTLTKEKKEIFLQNEEIYIKLDKWENAEKLWKLNFSSFENAYNKWIKKLNFNKI